MIGIDHRCWRFFDKPWSCVAFTIAILAAWLGSASFLFAAPGGLLWEDQFDQARRADFAVAVAAARGSVVVAGWTSDAARNRDILVRTYDGARGALRWQDKFDLAGLLDTATAVVANDSVAVIAGFGTNPAGNTDWLVRSYDIESGKLLWQDVRDIGGGNEQALDLALHENQVIATGIGGACANGFCHLITRAYDIRQGRLLWDARAAGVRADTATSSVVAHNGLVYVGANIAAPAANDTSAFFVQAYDIQTGKPVWQDRVQTASTDGFVHKITVRSGRVYAVGTTNSRWLVRAYDGTSGTVLWNDTFCLTCDAPGVTNAAFQVAADDERVIVAGYGSNPGPYRVAHDWIVRVYDAKTGRPLWTDRLDYAHHLDEAASGLALANNQVFSYGMVFSAAALQDLLIRTYDATDGTVLWQDRVDKSGVADMAAEAGRAGLAVDQGRVTIVGGSGIRRADGIIDTDWMVRTYETKAQLQN